MSITAKEVTAYVPTRGDVNMVPIVASLRGFHGSCVWDNSVRENLRVWGRYAAMPPYGLAYTQDDDVILPPESLEALVRAYRPGVIVCNVPKRFRPSYHDCGLVGFGAIFDVDLVVSAVRAYELAGGDVESDEFRRTCDIVVTMLNPLYMVDVAYEELPYAHDDSRMWKQPGHAEERASMRQFCREIRGRRGRGKRVVLA